MVIDNNWLINECWVDTMVSEWFMTKEHKHKTEWISQYIQSIYSKFHDAQYLSHKNKTKQNKNRTEQEIHEYGDMSLILVTLTYGRDIVI